MTCPLQTAETEILLDYSAGRLDFEKRSALELHMESCPECAAFRTEQNAVWEALDCWEPAPVSRDFNRRLWQRIDEAAATPWYGSLVCSLRQATWKPVIPLTAVILAIAGGFLLDHPGGTSTAPGVSVNEAQQVEQTLDDLQLLRQLDSAALPGGGKSM